MYEAAGAAVVVAVDKARVLTPAPEDLTTVILGFADRGSAGSQVDVVGRLMAPYGNG